MAEAPIPSPVSAVLHTTELLELILISLSDDKRTLLTAVPRVCQHWRATVTTSLYLRRALFFAPVPNCRPLTELKLPGQTPANKCGPDDLPRAIQPTANEFLVRRFRLGRFDEPDADYDGGYMPMVSMRWLNELREGWLSNAWGRKGGTDEEEREGTTAGEPSWRRMLIAQPPPRRVEIMVYGSSMFQSAKAWVESEEGVTLGLLHDKCQELAWRREWQKRTMGWYFEL